MLNRDLLRLYSVLEAIRAQSDDVARRRVAGEMVTGGCYSGRFGVASAYNMAQMKTQAEGLREAARPWHQAAEVDYQLERNTNLGEHLKLPDGVTTPVPGASYPIKDMDAFNAFEAGLREKYADALAAKAAWDALMEVEVAPAVTLLKIAVGDVPDGLPLETTEILMQIVEIPTISISETKP